MNPRPTLQEKFWVKVEKTETCWLWAACRTRAGYGQIGRWEEGRCKVYLAHRLSYEWAHGPIPPKMHIDHICHNPACVNPAHLRLTTVKQNLENRTGAQRNNKSSGVRGVTWCKHRNKWKAQVQHGGRNYSAGYHLTIEDAAAAAKAKRLALFTHSDMDRLAS